MRVAFLDERGTELGVHELVALPRVGDLVTLGRTLVEGGSLVLRWRTVVRVAHLVDPRPADPESPRIIVMIGDPVRLPVAGLPS